MKVLIMPDGNRRWAKENHKSIDEGYSYLSRKIALIIKVLQKHGENRLYVWCNSINNLRRPKEQVRSFFDHYADILSFILDPKKIKIILKGNLSFLKQKKFDALGGGKLITLEKKTHNNKGFKLYYYLNYTTEDDLIRSCIKKWGYCRQVGSNPRQFIKKLWVGLDEPNNLDLIIRFGIRPGWQRLSRFSPQKSPNAEIYFVKKYFPEITERDIEKAIQACRLRVIKNGR